MKLAVERAKDKVARLSKKLIEYGLVAGTWGNLSTLVPEENVVVITPSGMDYNCIQSADMVVLNLAGEVMDGERRPSSEAPLHLSIYRARQDVAGIVHTHSEVASAFAVARKPIQPVVEDAAMLVGGPVEVAAYALPGTAELAQNVVTALGQRNAVLMANHGLVGVGRSIEEAFTICQVVEKCARIYAWANTLGKPVILPEGDVAKLYRAYRESYGQPKK
ncbi:class II aldolase/adducin family protein [Desulfotomaculum nigrificans CO-1-SRB]|uniref:Class II aldolase/adducin family protein n=1 Tax=Desulfotomaculum nigrificans (strain DSM 14880 / VKM B-2319 / CO-1-SRB) TaxID=868595 RepID=F6B361_DESCC|nr:class II aldolase/adducin family protein [Desulfotomaculum nigrificans]AEF93965.1 class II aldolase/adducin family protein [Desulfotomaculum nigrificans CO-1-SRB]